MEYSEITAQARVAMKELLPKCHLHRGDIFVIGCSTSEAAGAQIGTASSENIAKAIYDGVKPVLDAAGVYLAAQCCEHLNRAIIVEKEALPPWTEICNVVPQMHAGGAFATRVYLEAKDPIAVEHIKAAAGMDIGGTLIGMHLRDVAVPVRLSVKKIGAANITCARTRPKYIGGPRAKYDPKLIGDEVKR